MAGADMTAFDLVVEERGAEYLGWLTDFLRTPSLAGRNIGLEEGAAAAAALLQRAGFRTEVWRRDSAAPVVFGEVGEGEACLLMYDHYDVQPAEPLELWTSPPFEPQVRDGLLYARGTSDNRGEVVARVAAIHAWRETMGELPLRLKFFIEGEEEVGSLHLGEYVEEHRGRLNADGVLWEGGEIDEGGRPSIALGGKGIAYVELHAAGPGYDLHSSLAAIVENPAWRLVQALKTLRSETGLVLIDGFLDDVDPLTDADTALLHAMPMDMAKLREALQVAAFLDHDELELKRRLVFAPTCNICGIESGYTGEGAKTVLPAKARCKIDFRLVPHQTPARVVELLRNHLDRRGFQDIEVHYVAGIAPSRSASDSRIARASLAAANEVYGGTAYFVPMFAGSGPFPHFAGTLGIPVASAGFTAYSESRAHSPNENIRVADWHTNIRFMGRLLDAFSRGA